MSIRNSHLVITVFAIALVVAVIGCNSGEKATVAPNPTSTPRPATATSVPTSTAPAATPTPSPTPTATPTPTPTPTPTAPDAAYLAIFDLAETLGAQPNSITVADFDEATWPSSAYGCPEPGFFYAQGQVSGWKIMLRANGSTYEYHTDGSGQLTVNCTENVARIARSINLVERANLRSTTEIEMRRRDATGAFVLKATVTDTSEIEAIVDTLDVLILPGPAASCTEVFRVVFKTPSGDQTIGTICGGNTRLVRGDHAFWAGQDANAPRQFNDIIAPYFSTDANPGLPQ